MNTTPMKRRVFVRTATRALGLLAFAGGLKSFTSAAAPAQPVSSELQEARKKILADLEANRGLAVPPEDGDFLHLMVCVTEARRVLEVGTFKGYSAIRMGIGLEQTDGKLTTIEIDPKRVKESKANVAKAGLSDRVTCLEGDAHQVAKTVDGPFDLVFLDAEKGGEIDYFNTIFPKLHPGGFLLLHNALMYKRAMQPYFDLISKHPEIIHVVLSLSMKDGFSVGYRKKR